MSPRNRRFAAATTALSAAFLSLVSLCLLVLLAAPAQAEQVKGWNVTRADFGWNGTQQGTFRQTGDATWDEVSASNGNSFRFNEQNRDEWSVYLHDPSRNVNIQIDLHTKKIYYSDSNTPRREQYQLMNTSAKVNGWLARRVTFGQNGTQLGTYRQTGGDQWAEVPVSRRGNTFQFKETNRDEWSVYLHDTSRDVRIQIDLHTRKIYYSDANSSRRELYDVFEAFSK